MILIHLFYRFLQNYIRSATSPSEPSSGVKGRFLGVFFPGRRVVNHRYNCCPVNNNPKTALPTSTPPKMGDICFFGGSSSIGCTGFNLYTGFFTLVGRCRPDFLTLVTPAFRVGASTAAIIFASTVASLLAMTGSAMTTGATSVRLAGRAMKLAG